jgi:hypothetical protein
MDIDEEILYWIEQLGYEPINTGKLIDYIKENYVKRGEDIIDEWCELKGWKVDKDYLDWNMIIRNDYEYDKVDKDKFLNVYQLEHAELELKRLNLII